MNDLVIKDITYELPKINYDLKYLEDGVSAIEKKYKGLVLKEDDIKGVRKDLEDINKLSAKIDSQRKENVKAIIVPVTKYEQDIKAIKKTLDDTYRRLKDQLDDFVLAEKNKKKAKILALPEFKDYMEFDEKWLTDSMVKIQKDLELKTQKHNEDIESIKTICESLKLKSDKYNDLLNDRKSIEDILAIIKNDRKVIDDNKPEPVVDNLFLESLQQPEPVVVQVVKPIVKVDGLRTVDLRISATIEQMNGLKDYMDFHNITYLKL